MQDIRMVRNLSNVSVLYIVYMKTVYIGIRVYVSSKIFHGSENINILKSWVGRSKHFLFSKTSWRLLPRNNFSSSETCSTSLLQHVFNTSCIPSHLENVLEDRKCYAEDVFNMSSRRQMFAAEFEYLDVEKLISLFAQL